MTKEELLDKRTLYRMKRIEWTLEKTKKKRQEKIEKINWSSKFNKNDKITLSNNKSIYNY